jgi:ketosteroid isomerase-like protein
MSADRNRATALNFLAALYSGDAKAVIDALTEDAVYAVAARPELFPVQPARSRREFSKIVAAMQGAFEVNGLSITGTVAEGNKVAIEGISDGRLRNGKAYANTYHYLITFRGDKICAVKEYMDTLYASHVFGL